MFTAIINGTDLPEASIIADGTKYKIELKALNGVEITDGKSATVSVSNGILYASNNLDGTSNSSSISTTIAGNATTFYYQATSKGQTNTLLTITVEGITQTFVFTLKPSEPDKILMSPSIISPGVGDNVEITAFLIKNTGDGHISTGLKVFFTVTKADPTEEIVANVSVPGYNPTVIDSNDFTVAKTTILTNKKPGTVTVTASYTKLDGTIVSEKTDITYVQ